MIKVTGSKVLVEEVKIKKLRAIIVPGQSNVDQWDISYTVLQVGPLKVEGWEDVKVGDSPVFSQYVQFASVKAIEKSQAKTVMQVIVDVTDIIATDNDEVVSVDNIEVVEETIVGDTVEKEILFTEETIIGEEVMLEEPILLDEPASNDDGQKPNLIIE